GIGISHGFSEGWVAGAIISGAYFGDKISPLSDTTVLASSMVNVPIMKHIRYMLITTIPAMVIALIVFTIAGLSHSSMGESQVEMFTSALDSRFNISLWLLIVPVVTGIMIARRMSSIITLFLSAALSGVFAVIFQADILREIAQHTEGAWQIVEGIMTTYFASTSLESTSPLLEELISTRGMGGMLSTLWLIICAMCFGGSMTASGLLGSLMSVFARKVKSTFGLVSSTIASGLTLNLITADQYISIILTGQVFRSTYRETGHEDRLLSRSTEDAATVTSALIPWNSCGMTHSTILGVPTLTYLPYCFFNILSPIMSLVIAYIGYKIYKPSKKSVTTSIEKTA
ncbi:MAG: sodium:proton antiporter, partial [Flavobacteriales bacterium]|nr:sodium:proton antiporter [Flavobacteriales bacterium]